MNKLKTLSHVIGLLTVGSSIWLAFVSVHVLHVQTYERLQAVQDMQIGALETSSDAVRRIVKNEFWLLGIQQPSDNFYAINADTGYSVAISQLTGQPIELTNQGLTSDRTFRIKVDYYGRYVFSVGRLYTVDGVDHEFFAETGLVDAYKYAWHLLSLHIISIFFAIMLYKFTSIVVQIALRARSKTRVISAISESDTDMYLEYFKQCPQGTILLASDGIIIDLNERLAHTFGYEVDELIGSHINDLLPERFRSGHMSLVNGFLGKNEPGMSKAREVTGLRKDGVEISINLSVGMLTSFSFKGKRTIGAGLTVEN